MNRDNVLALLSANPHMFYVYGLISPRDQRLFYVGEGKNRRVFAHLKKSSLNAEGNWRKRKILFSLLQANLEPDYILFGFYASKQDALAREAELIAEHGFEEDGGLLTNMVSLGRGTSDCSPDLRAKRAAITREWLTSMTAEEKAEFHAKRRAALAAKSPAEKALIITQQRNTWAAKKPDERAAHKAKALAARMSMSAEDTAIMKAKTRASWAAKTPEQLAIKEAKRQASLPVQSPEAKAAWHAKMAAKLATRTPREKATSEVKRLASLARTVAARRAA